MQQNRREICDLNPPGMFSRKHAQAFVYSGPKHLLAAQNSSLCTVYGENSTLWFSSVCKNMPSNTLSLFNVNYLITIKVNLLNHRKTWEGSPRLWPSISHQGRKIEPWWSSCLSREKCFTFWHFKEADRKNENLKVTLMLPESKDFIFKVCK